jgi:hypothetical protein
LLTLSLIPMFMRSIICLNGLKNTLNSGTNKIRYLSRSRRLTPGGPGQPRAAEDVPLDALRTTYNITIEIEDGSSHR